jgi:hypothetical protein
MNLKFRLFKNVPTLFALIVRIFFYATYTTTAIRSSVVLSLFQTIRRFCSFRYVVFATNIDIHYV